MGWDERNDEYLIEFTEQELREHDKQVIEEYKESCIEEIKKLYEFWKANKKNRPRPDLKSAIVIMNLVENLKEQKNG